MSFKSLETVQVIVRRIGRAAFAAVCVATLSAFGAGVTGDDAKGAVTGWVRLREALGDEIDAEPESVATYPGADGRGEFHVVSLKGGGYVIDLGDIDMTNRKNRIPLFKVGTADMLPAPEALQFVGGIPKGWKLKTSKDGYGYDLARRQFMVIVK